METAKECGMRMKMWVHIDALGLPPEILVCCTIFMHALNFGFHLDTATRCYAMIIFTHCSSSLTSPLFKNRIPTESA